MGSRFSALLFGFRWGLCVRRAFVLVALLVLFFVNKKTNSNYDDFKGYRFSISEVHSFNQAMEINNTQYGYLDYRMFKSLGKEQIGKEIIVFSDQILDTLLLSSIAGLKVIVNPKYEVSLSVVDEEELNPLAKSYSSIFLVRPVKFIPTVAKRLVLAEAPYSWFIMDEEEFLHRVRVQK